MRVKIKFCGMTNVEDAQAAARMGVDAVGVVLYPPAPVAVDLTTAAAIAAALPPLVSAVALLVNADSAYVQEVIETMRPSLLQFHGDESVDYCQSFSMPYIKACRVACGDDIVSAVNTYDSASGILLDAKVADCYGGSGQMFDWKLIPDNINTPLIVAGGLTPLRVRELLSVYRPWAVDVSSGIAESDNKRRKNFDTMQQFIQEVQHAI